MFACLTLSPCSPAQFDRAHPYAAARGPVTHVTQLSFGIDSADGGWGLHRYVATDQDMFLLSYSAPGHMDTARVTVRRFGGRDDGSVTAFSHDGRGRLGAVAKTTDQTLRGHTEISYASDVKTGRRVDVGGEHASTQRWYHHGDRVVARVHPDQQRACYSQISVSVSFYRSFGSRTS